MGQRLSLVQKILDSKFLNKNQLSILIGTDNANTIHTWKSYEILLEMVSFVVLERPGEVFKESGQWCLSNHINIFD